MSLKKLARISGLSKTQVSRALLDQPGVALATRERVKAIADRLGYHPQAAARALATGRRDMIGLTTATGELGNPWHMAVMDGVSGFLEEHGLHIVIFRTEPTEPAPSSLLAKAVDGVVLATFWTPAFLDQLLSLGFPVVAANPGGVATCDCVRIDDTEAAAQGTRHLVELGHRQIAYVGSGSRRGARLNQLRWLGYVQAMSAAGLPICPGCDARISASESVPKLFSENPPTALVCFNDQIAFNAAREVRRIGLEAPRDVSIVGMDDLWSRGFFDPPLTTVRIPFRDIGREAARLVLERVENATLERRDVVLHTELIVRESTAPPRGEST